MNMQMNETPHTASSTNAVPIQEFDSSPPSYDEVCRSHGGGPSQSQQRRSPDVAINVDDRFGPTCAPVLTREQIVDGVIDRSIRIGRNQRLRLFIPCIPASILTAIPWITWAAMNCSSTFETDCSASDTWYYFGIALACITGSLLLWALIYGAVHHSYSYKLEALKNQVRCVVKLEGDHWTRYVNYLYGPNRAEFRYLGLVGSLSYCCRNSHHKRLIERGYGYIILCRNGFILDEILHIVRNEPHIFLNVSYVVGMGLRLRIVRSDGTYTVHRSWNEGTRRQAAFQAINQQTETLDIYMPQTMPENALLLLALQVQHGL